MRRLIYRNDIRFIFTPYTSDIMLNGSPKAL